MFKSRYNKAALNAITPMGSSRKMAGDHAKFDRWLLLAATMLLIAALLSVVGTRPAHAAPRYVSCGGAAMLGAALLNCSHLAPAKPAQLCNFSWSLSRTGNVPQVVSGSFLMPPGAANVQVYQGAGFVAALAAPVVLCQDQN